MCSADTGALGGLGGSNASLPATMYVLSISISRSKFCAEPWMCRYKYDVEEGTLAFGNRRTFAYADTGAADGSSNSLTPFLITD